MPAQQQIEIGMGGLSIDFWGMRQEDGEFPIRYLRSGLFDIVDPKVVRVIYSSQINPLIAARDRLALIEQHPYSHGFQPRNHLDRVMIAEHAINWSIEMGSHSCDAVQGCRERSKSFAPKVAGQNTQVVTQTISELHEVSHRALIHVHMHVADVKYGEAIEQ